MILPKTIYTQPPANGCQQEGTPRDIPAFIMSLNDVEMVVQIATGSERDTTIDITAPVGTGELVPDCGVQAT